MITFTAVDGTSTEEETYKETYKNSFINKLYRSELVNFIEPWYLRGPYLSGFDTRTRAEAAYKHAKGMWTSGKAKALFLGGHSRGGAAVIEVAKWLKADGIPVECLILFDAVDRTHTLGSIFGNTPIADNVKRVIHARRNVLRTQSRLSFGNCGTTYENSNRTTLFQEYFFATHSGVGGVPWSKAVVPLTGIPILTIWEPGELKATFVTPAYDHTGSEQSWNWAKSHIAFAYDLCRQRLEKENPVGDKKPDFQIPNQKPGGSLPPTGDGNGGKKPQIHTVKSGDWLSKIAIQYYGDMNKWKTIYEVPANKATIGANPDLIKPGQQLIIP
ncbi:MAG: LysM peptidoglycan-binding domain-containing protein [Pyrinomonadaceae bacterium]|nr:LysM peptidoglycan-binding domain-containing protein [Pyrinomonadaceae bacterium]